MTDAATTDPLPPGTRVVVADSYGASNFWGLACRVKEPVDGRPGSLWVRPLADRPDADFAGEARAPFQIHRHHLLVDPPLHDPAALGAWLDT